MSYLDEIDDPRKPSNGTLHDFREILVILIAAVFSDCDTVEDITFWARTKEAWLRRFLVLKNGIPSEETFLRILRALDPKQFENMFRRWVGGVVGALSDDAGPGWHDRNRRQDVCGLGTGGESAIHMVSAFATELGLVLGQEKVAAKSNEITAIPEPPRHRRSRACWSRSTPWAARKALPNRSLRKKGDYLLMVKGNQPKLLEAIEIAFIDQHGVESVDRSTLVERGHGAPSGRSLGALGQGHRRSGRLAQMRDDRAHRLHAGGRRQGVRSGAALLHQLARPPPSNWLPRCERIGAWRTGFTGSSTSASARTPARSPKDNAPQNLSMLRKIALNIIRADKTDTRKSSLRPSARGAAG